VFKYYIKTFRLEKWSKSVYYAYVVRGEDRGEEGIDANAYGLFQFQK